MCSGVRPHWGVHIISTHIYDRSTLVAIAVAAAVAFYFSGASYAASRHANGHACFQTAEPVPLYCGTM